MPLRGLENFDAIGALCPDALLHFGSGIQVQPHPTHQICAIEFYYLGASTLVRALVYC